MTLYVAEATVGCIKQCYQGVIDQATQKQFLLLIKELIQYGFVLSGEIREMDVREIDTMRSLAEVMTSEMRDRLPLEEVPGNRR